VAETAHVPSGAGDDAVEVEAADALPGVVEDVGARDVVVAGARAAFPGVDELLVLDPLDEGEPLVSGGPVTAAREEAPSASGFLVKSAPPARLVEAVRTVAGGDSLLAPTITRRLVEQFAARPRPGQAVPPGSRS
jgi:hypothetical protein